MVTKILVAVDGFAANTHPIYQQAIALAKATGAELKLIHVLTPAEHGLKTVYRSGERRSGNLLTAERPLKDIDRALWQRFEIHCLELLEIYAEKAQRAGIAVSYEQLKGIPEQVICAVARKWGADLIIVGHPDPQALERADQYILKHAPCSTLFVKAAAASATAAVAGQEEYRLVR